MAAGKLVAEKTRQAREAQKKAAAEAAVIIANDKGKKARQRTTPTPEITEDEDRGRSSSMSTTQWLMAGSILVSLLGLYYKREELKSGFQSAIAAGQQRIPNQTSTSRLETPTNGRETSHVAEENFVAPPVKNFTSSATTKVGLRKMD